MADKKVIVPKAFKFNTGNGVLDIAAGIQTIPAEYAEHWYVKEHTIPFSKEAEAKLNEMPAIGVQVDRLTAQVKKLSEENTHYAKLLEAADAEIKALTKERDALKKAAEAK